MKFVRLIIWAGLGSLLFYFAFKNRKVAMRLTPDFRLYEFIKTSTGLFNYPEEQGIINNIEWMAMKIAQPIRDEFGLTKITSGYRSDKVNEAVGGVPDSVHKTGLAIDIQVPDVDLKRVFNWLKISGLPLKKVIFEKGKNAVWLHIEGDKKGLILNNPEFLIANWNPAKEKMEYSVA